MSLKVSSFTLLSKGLRPLPFGKEETDAETGERRVYSGFTDVEARYRQRYADLAVNPEVRDVFVGRAKVVTRLPALSGRARLRRGGDAGAAAAVRRARWPGRS